MNYKLFIDLDGVLADFTRGVDIVFKRLLGEDFSYDEDEFERNMEYRTLMWDTVAEYQSTPGCELWYELQPMPDARNLWTHISLHPYEILTATGPPKYNAAEQKIRWVSERIDPYVKVNTVRKAVEKAQFAAPNHILIDDKEKALNPWKEAGGIGVLHTNALNTIAQLRNIGL